jgi:hypothetical protein
MPKTILSITIVCCILTVNNSLFSQGDNAVPEAWLDSLEANHWRMKKGKETSIYRSCMIAQQLDKNDEVKNVDTTWFLSEFDSDGNRVKHETDQDGNIIKRGEATEDKDTEENNKTVELASSPFDPIRKEYRSDYRITLAGKDDSGNPIIAYKPEKHVEDGFTGQWTIDTTHWTPLRFEGSPIKFPTKKIKEMNLIFNFNYDEDGLVRLSKTDTRMQIRILLLNIRMRAIEEYFDYNGS